MSELGRSIMFSPSVMRPQPFGKCGALAFATVAGKTSVSHLPEGTGSRSKLGGSILFKREPSQVAGRPESSPACLEKKHERSI